MQRHQLVTYQPHDQAVQCLHRVVVHVVHCLAARAAAGAATLPDGVRLVLDMPAGHALTGRITHDWVRPTVGGGKS